MLVLVTGANGYIGRHACGALRAAGHEVAAVSRRRTSPDASALTWYEGDLLDPETPSRIIAASKPDAILHLAWEVTHGRFWTAADNLDWVASSLALARAAHDQSVPRFVATGTCYEYGWPDNSDCIEGETPVCNHLLYDTAKDATHRILSSFCNQTGVSFAWARIFNLYGGDEPAARLVPDVINSVLAGKVAECSSGTPVRDYMDVRDVGAGLAALVTSPVAGAVNIASGHGHPIAEIASLIGEIAGRPDLIGLGKKPDRPGEPPRIVADTRRMRNEVGFKPSIGLENGLADAVEWWKGRAGEKSA